MITISRTKFNVNRDNSERTYDGIVFDSVLEMKYYRDVLSPMVQNGEVIRFELQKSYELQPKFRHDDKSVRPIIYVADFYMVFKNGKELVVDTKGFPDPVANIKRKMFWYCYPELEYKWITYVKKYGGWIEYDIYKKLKKENKKKKLLEEKENEGI